MIQKEIQRIRAIKKQSHFVSLDTELVGPKRSFSKKILKSQGT